MVGVERVMSEKPKITTEELQKRLSDLTELVESSRVELEGMIRRKPLESAGVAFLAGIVVGVLVGASIARRG